MIFMAIFKEINIIVFIEKSLMTSFYNLKIQNVRTYENSKTVVEVTIIMYKVIP